MTSQELAVSYPMPGYGAATTPVDPADGRSARRSMATLVVAFGFFVVAVLVVLLWPMRAQTGQVFGFSHDVTATVTRVHYVPKGYKTSPHDVVTVRWTDPSGPHTGSDTTPPGRYEVGDTVAAHVSGGLVSLQSHGNAVALVCGVGAMLLFFGAFVVWGWRGWHRLRALPHMALTHPPVRLQLGYLTMFRGTARMRWQAGSGGTPGASGRLQVFRRADRSLPGPGEVVDAYAYRADGRGPFLLHSRNDGRWTYASGKRLPAAPAGFPGRTGVAPPTVFER